MNTVPPCPGRGEHAWLLSMAVGADLYLECKACGARGSAQLLTFTPATAPSGGRP